MKMASSGAGRALLVALVAVSSACLERAAAGAVTPAQQVINMLSEMKVKGVKMMKTEKLTYVRYAQWVDDTAKDLALQVKEAEAKIEELVAFATKADSDVAALGREISALNAEIDKLEGEKAAATEDRKDEHDEYLKMSQDYAESVDALERAIQVLSAQNYDRAQAESMLQKMAQTVPGMPRVLAAFLQEKGRSGGGALRGDGAPEVAAYEFQSGRIMDVLKGLLDKFRAELADTETAEANAAHAFNLVELHLSNTIKADSSERDEKMVTKGKKAEESAKAKGELAQTKLDKAADEKLKAETESTFEVKKAAFEENQEVRAAELEAIDKAIEILSSPEVQDSYAKHLALTQRAAKGKGQAPSFLQMGRRSRRVATRMQASEFLRKRAKAIGSKALADLAAQVTANPFAKVIDMIETLLEKLKEVAASEADHKAWCDEELKNNKLKRNEKTAQVNKLMAEVESAVATIADMGAGIEKLAKEQAELTSAMAEATELRTAEKAENEAAIADAAAGADAVKRALVILKEFYDGQGGSAALLQQHRQVPEMAAYKGMQNGKGGVIGMLEVIESDFTRLRTETEANENAAANEYSSFMKESEAAKKQKHDAEFQLRLDKDQEEFEKSRLEKDLASVQEELKQANAYFAELKPSCVQVHVSFEERVQARKEEIEALKEAYKILHAKSAESSA